MNIKCKYYEPGATMDFCASTFNCADIRYEHGSPTCVEGELMDVDWTGYIFLKGVFEE